MPALGDPPPPVGWQEPRSAHGVPAPAAYIPAPIKKSDAVPTGHGLRPSGRRVEETRPCHLHMGVVSNAAGSAYIEQGRTKIFAAVYGPRQAGDRMQHQASSEGVICVDLQFAPFCSCTMSKEENDKRAILYNSILLRALESAVLLERYGKSAFDVHIMVLEDDGGVLTAALAIASLALADARVEMRDLIAGATVHLAGSVEGNPGGFLLDCDLEEESRLPDGSAVLHVGFCTARGTVCLLHSSGPLPTGPFEQMSLLAKDTAEVIGAEMRRCLESQVDRRVAKRARLNEGEVAEVEDIGRDVQDFNGEQVSTFTLEDPYEDLDAMA